MPKTPQNIKELNYHPKRKSHYRNYSFTSKRWLLAQINLNKLNNYYTNNHNYNRKDSNYNRKKDNSDGDCSRVSNKLVAYAELFILQFNDHQFNQNSNI